MKPRPAAGRWCDTGVEGLSQTQTLPEVGNSHARIVAVIALVLLVPVILALTVFPTVMPDTRELINWGRNLTLVTPDHPPMMVWVGGAIEKLFGHGAPVVMAANQLLMVIGIVYVFRILRLVCSTETAWLYTLLYGTSAYFAFGPLSFALNADILQLVSWPPVIYHCLRAGETNRHGQWIAFGVWSAIALITKYNAAVLFISLGAGMLVVPQYRVMLRRPGFWLAVAIGVVLMLPHFLAVLHQRAAVAYAANRFSFGDLAIRLHSISLFLQGHLSFLMPGLFVVGYGLWTRRMRVDGALLQEPRRKFLFVANLVGQSILLGFIFIGGLDYVSRYSAPYVLLLTLALAPLVTSESDWKEQLLRRLPGVLAAIYAVAVVTGCVIYGFFASHLFMQEPIRPAAKGILAQWDREFACGPAYIAGLRPFAYGLGLESGPQVIGLFYNDIGGAPWYDLDRLRAGGAILIDAGPDLQKHIDKFLGPGLKAGELHTLTVPLQRTGTNKTMTYFFHFIAPADCSRPGLRQRGAPG